MKDNHTVIRIAVDKNQWEAFKAVAKSNHRTANGEIRKMICEKIESHSDKQGDN